jgi:hypothetical protein
MHGNQNSYSQIAILSLSSGISLTPIWVSNAKHYNLGPSWSYFCYHSLTFDRVLGISPPIACHQDFGYYIWATVMGCSQSKYFHRFKDMQKFFMWSRIVDSLRYFF